MKKNIIILISAVIMLVLLLAYNFLVMPVTSSGNASVNIDRDDTADSVYMKISSQGGKATNVRIIASLLNYKNNIHTGHYKIDPDMSALQLVRKMRGGMQDPIRLTIPYVRTKEQLAHELGEKLMLDSTEMIGILNDSLQCAKWDADTSNIICLFIPNTHEIYWNISSDKLMGRIQKEYRAFWNADRMKLADKTGLSPYKVITLASIVDEETANKAEMPSIAGMYLNRLKIGMPLQADPTIKFALRNFSLKRIYTKLTQTESPYNTYRNLGLPPGPIRIPSVASIDAVLHYEQNDYLYMCAKEDFSGTHNFAHTYGEHLVNAKKYTQALNAKGIQ